MNEEIKAPEGCRLVTDWERANNEKAGVLLCIIDPDDPTDSWSARFTGDCTKWNNDFAYAVPTDYEFPNKEPIAAESPLSISQETVEFKPIVITINTPEMMTKIVNECQEFDENNGEVLEIIALILNAVAENKIIF